MPGRVTVVDYGLGNLGSILSMLKFLGVAATASSEPAEISVAEKLIIGGVGSFDAGIESLRSRGLVPALDEAALGRRVPILGICLGMQLLTEKSEEGKLPGLGWVPGETIRFQDENGKEGLRIPHMGWNEVEVKRDTPLARGLPEDPRFYFVHSYHVRCRDEGDVLGIARYGGAFCAMLQRGNLYGTQFHPEKSHRFGMALLRSFAFEVA